MISDVNSLPLQEKYIDMKVNLSAIVKDLCRMQGITLKDLAHKIGIAPESLSRTLNGNPQLSTLEAIASNLGVNLSDLFSTSHETNSASLHSIIVYNGNTYVSDNLNNLISSIKEICTKEGIEL